MRLLGDPAGTLHLLEVDTELPWRDVLFDERLMLGEFDAAIADRVHSCDVVRSKYRIGESIRVSYELGTSSGRRRVSVRCFPAGRTNVSISGREPDLELAHLDTLGWVFPNDRRLWSLELLWNRPDVRERVAGRDVDRLELASYAPEKAATLRCRDADRCTGFVKVRAGATHRPVAARYAQLQPALARRGTAAPALVRVDDELGMLLISAVSGEPLVSSAEVDDWASVGAAIGSLHCVEPAVVPAVKDRFDRLAVSSLLTAASLVGAVRADAGSRARQLVASLAASPPDDAVDVVLHGDLHAKNVLVHSQGPAIIDLDQASLGPAAADLGSFIAAVLCDHANPLPAERRIAAVLDGYGRVRPLPSRRSIEWYTAAALLAERALRAVNRMRRLALADLGGVLDLAMEIERRSR